MKYQDIEFISAESDLAQIKQELRTYFETGAMTEFLFPTYIDDVLRKMKFFGLEAKETVLHFQDYKSMLPPDFHKLRSAKMYEVEVVTSNPAAVLRGHWYQTFETTDGCNEAESTTYYEQFILQLPETTITLKAPKMLRVYYSARDLCVDGCPNLSYISTDVLKIERNLKVTSSFREGCVLVKYFNKPLDEGGVPMIPEIFEVQQYLMSYIKYKLFEALWHSTADESQAQIRDKFVFYRQEQYDKLAAANAAVIQQTQQQVRDNVARRRTRFSKFNIK